MKDDPVRNKRDGESFLETDRISLETDRMIARWLKGRPGIDIASAGFSMG
jgi:hypothetical protein